METVVVPKIALLSTGDEIINGEIINTNSQAIADQLFDHFIQPGDHLTTSDDQTEIEQAMQFLLENHAGLIVTGGLGPTSDDRTRFALGRVLNSELVFDEACWQRIVARLQRLSLPIPDSNRQQCLFPRQAIIFPNDNGTASACQVMRGAQPIFMLPGPPFECLPIFTQNVLPYLQRSGFTRPLFRCEWLLLGVSEGRVAEQLDPLAENSGCYLGYRVNQPYVEVKLLSTDRYPLEKLRWQFDAIIGAQSVSAHKQKASAQWIEWILNTQTKISIDDQATGGLLATTLLTPESYPFLHFTSQAQAIHIKLSGLESYWRKQPESKTSLQLDILFNQQHHQAHLLIPFRKERTPLFAVEMACWEMLRCFKNY